MGSGSLRLSVSARKMLLFGISMICFSRAYAVQEAQQLFPRVVAEHVVFDEEQLVAHVDVLDELGREAVEVHEAGLLGEVAAVVDRGRFVAVHV